MTQLFRLLFILLFLIVPSSITFAESEGLLNQLLAPGPLILGHAKLEGKDCLKCHDAGKGISDAKCMECHKEIKPFVTQKKGFHGLASKTQSCFQCHTDHKGRDFNSTVVDTKKFNHFEKTGYTLEGKHSDLKCQECHTEKRTQKPVRKTESRYLGQASTCISCHKKDDIHFFKGDFTKKDCNACHTNTSWKENITFSHNTDTKFKLVERHEELKCNDCHQIDKKKKVFRYQWTALAKNQCLSCHTDFHKKNLSPKYATGKCTTCHNQTKWTLPNFKHEVTGFKLNGEHAVSKCIDCHKNQKQNIKIEVKKFNFTGLKQNCTSCHKDYHQFGNLKNVKFGPLSQCLKCHNESSWNESHTFDHNVHTKYRLDGEHLKLTCIDCHLPQNKPPVPNKTPSLSKLTPLKGPTYHWKNLDSNSCVTCHSSPHLKEFSKTLLAKKCSDCHTTESWFTQKSNSGFDHNKTRFALTGSHKATRCSDCHGPAGKQIFKFKSIETKFCIDCHTNVHTGQFKTLNLNINSCTQCHNTEKFSDLKSFNHNLTAYKLEGKHTKVNCSECHTPTKADPYKLVWPNFASKQNDKTKNLLKPKSELKFANLKQNQCLTCHQDQHAGQLSNTCTNCHSVNDWKPAKFDHAKQSQFKIVGKHIELKCVDCHKPTDKKITVKGKAIQVVQYKPIATTCITCHNDYHRGQLDTNCSNCHSEKNWKPALFDHNKQSRFPLFAKHTQVSCIKCHKNTNEKTEYKGKARWVTQFKPLGTTCVECHKDPHSGSFGKQCAECHSERNWKSTKEFHKNFTLSGVHFSMECTECHKDGKKLAGLSQQCLSCHQKDDIHNGSLPNCKSCHSQQFWEMTTFRHSMTRFALRGAHRVIDCSACHQNGTYKGLSNTCVACHLTDYQANPTPHTSGNTNCIECHRNTFTFKNTN